MERKDPKDMTASELLRWAANGQTNDYGISTVHGKLLSALSGKPFAESTNVKRPVRDAAGEIAKIADFVFGEEAPC